MLQIETRINASLDFLFLHAIMLQQMNVNEMIVLAERLSQSYDDKGFYNGSSTAAGGWRSVLVTSKYAFKTVRCKADRDCQAEWDFYHMTTDAIRAFLSKPFYISHNGNTIVMEVLNVDLDSYGHAVSDRLNAKLSPLMYKTYGFDFSDMKDLNVGQRDDGTVVMLDYGNILFDMRPNMDADFTNPKVMYRKQDMQLSLTKRQY